MFQDRFSDDLSKNFSMMSVRRCNSLLILPVLTCERDDDRFKSFMVANNKRTTEPNFCIDQFLFDWRLIFFREMQVLRRFWSLPHYRQMGSLSSNEAPPSLVLLTFHSVHYVFICPSNSLLFSIVICANICRDGYAGCMAKTPLKFARIFFQR